MKLMIDISDSTYEAIMARDWKNAGWLFGEELKAIHDGTPIPENTTNGDMIQALFPDEEFTVKDYYQGEQSIVVICNKDNSMEFEPIWWRSPYKRGETE